MEDTFSYAQAGHGDGLQLARRRAQERPVPGEPLSFEKPEVKEVMDSETGQHLAVSLVMGTDYERLMQLRMAVRTAMLKDDPMYRCSLCGVAVYICRAKDRPKFFFRHQHEDGSCPARTKGSLSQEEINARKYAGAKESKLHIRMKNWVCQCLIADGRFEEVAQEPTWKGELTGTRRRPDVRAVYNGLPIAFEVQLSTTYLEVIAARRDFYMQEGGLLVWLFAEFETDHRRMTEDDVFFNNNLNAFVVDAKTVEASLEAGEFRLECVWAQPVQGGGHSGLHRKQVSFHELGLDPARQHVYFFDYEGARRKLEADLEIERQELREEFESWMGATGYYEQDSQDRWLKFHARFKGFGVELLPYVGSFDRPLLTALYSAKHNRPWGQSQLRLVEVAHRVANSQKRDLIWFMHAVRKYGRLETMEQEGDPARWAARYKERRAEYRIDPKPFEPRRESQAMVEFLLPELLPLP